MVFGLLSHAASVAVGALYPAFKTFKVIRDGNYMEMKRWLKYWTVYAGFLAAETVTDALFLEYIIPGYFMLKFGFLFWTVNPWTDGASVIHHRLVAPLLTKYEEDIDGMLDSMRCSLQKHISSLGTGAFNKARIGLLSLTTVDSVSNVRRNRSNESPSVIVAVEEQAEEDVVFLRDENARIKMELEDREINSSLGTSLEANSENYDNVDVISSKRSRRFRKNKRAGGDIEVGPSRRARRVTADRSASRGR